MSNSEATTPAPSTTATGPGVVSTGWLAADSHYGHEDKSRLGAGLGASLALHGVLLGLLLLIFAVVPQEALDLPDQVINLVFLPDPGPGGGGGGSPEAAPPKPIEIPRPKAPEPIPVTPPPIVPPPVVPPPQLNAPVITPNAQMLQSSGLATISLARQGGGGRGQGIGTGQGRGLGEGEGGGTGGGIFRPGAGISEPRLLRDVRPSYTPDAMRAKIQGFVVLEVVVLTTGLVGDVRVVKSLDPNGLDQEAIKAAKRWQFQPATNRQGQPVPVYVTLELNFRIF